MKFLIFFFLFSVVFSVNPVVSLDTAPELVLPNFSMTSIDTVIEVKSAISDNFKIFRVSDGKKIICNIFNIKERKFIKARFIKTNDFLVVQKGDKEVKYELRLLPGYLSLLPPLIAIFLAFVTKDVIISLLLGVFVGGIFVYNMNPFTSVLRVTDNYILNALYDKDHLSIILFSMVLGGMIGIISNSGGAKGIVNVLSRFVKNCRTGQLSTWMMGIVIFFDDYANTLLVGNTMRPLSDKLRISREKLSYIVDSTAAPVASLFVVSTWIGYELGQISEALKSISIQSAIAIEYQKMSAIAIFIKTIPFRFYAIFTLFFVVLIATMLRDFGPMYHAEKRARRNGKLYDDDAKPLSSLDQLMDSKKEIWVTAFVPIVSLILIVISGLWFTGRNAILANGGPIALAKAGLHDILGSSASMDVLIWGSFLSTFIAVIVSVLYKALTIKECVEAWVNGLKSMLLAMIILVLSWSLSSVCKDLFTSQYVGEIAKSHISYIYFPVLIFCLSGFIAFSTGTSWGTMGILFPIAIPVSFELVVSLPADYAHNIILGTIAAVLSGASFGDHCSPISDTTIMSSMASGCDHIDHVKTQIPYAFTSGLISGVMGFTLIGMGVSPFISIILGCSLLAAILGIFGKKTDEKTVMNEIMSDMKSNDIKIKENAIYDLGTFKTSEASETLVRYFLTSDSRDNDKMHDLVLELGAGAYSYIVDQLGKDNCRTLAALRMISELIKQHNIHDLKQSLLVQKLDVILKSKAESDDVMIKAMVIAGQLKLFDLLQNILDLLESSNTRIKATAVLTFGMLGSSDVFEKLREIIRKSDGRIRANAIESLIYLSGIDQNRIKEIVSPFISDENYRIRTVSKRVLFKVSEDKGIIESFLKDYNQAKSLNEKLSIIFVLGEISNITAIRMLLRFLETETDPVCTQKIIELIRKKGQTSILPFINEFLTKNCKGSIGDVGQL